MLVTVDELDPTAGPAGCTVLDVRWALGRTDGREQYLEGHIPGAVYVDLATDLAAPAGAGGRHPLPETATFEAAMRRCGVSNDRPVVVYDDAGGTSAARAWWLLRFHGHPDVAVLDGAWSAWRDAGRPVERGEVAVVPGDFEARPGQLPVLDAAGAASVAQEGVLIDARAPERYRGETEPIDPVAGHIPGAVNVPTTVNLVDGRFATSEVLRDSYRAALESDGPVAAYCGSGVHATHDLLALSLLGVEAALYPGSWSEWVRDDTRAVETGDTPGA